MDLFEERAGGEPTEPPSEKRLREARRRGDVPWSREVTAAAVFLGVALLLLWRWPALVGTLRGAMAAALGSAAQPSAPRVALEGGLATLLTASWPILAGAFAVALVASFAQVGALLTGQPLNPTLRRLSPAVNLRRVIGPDAAFELFKTGVKLAGIGYVAVGALWDELPRVLATVGRPPEALLEATLAGLATIAWRTGIVVVILAAADLLYQRHAHSRRMRMTRLEVQREQREREGDPQRKAERQRIHREIVAHQVVESVASADCVIVDATRAAVALRYDAETMEAPMVIATGERLVAARIRDLARRAGIPIVQDTSLARALLELPPGQQVSPAHYEAVAEVFRFVRGGAK